MSFRKYFPRRKPRDPSERCDKYRPDRKCEGRIAAEKMGQFGYDPRRKGYYCTDLPFLNSGVPMILEGCPYCFEELASHFLHAPEVDTPKQEPRRGLGAPDATAYCDEDPLDEGLGHE
jgi:hypothetical protein